MSRETNLKAIFYTAFDASLIACFLAKVSAKREAERRAMSEFIGEGSHFQSFQIAASPIPLAVNVAKSTFTQKGDAAIGRWKAAVELARSLEHADLIPPMCVVSGSGLTAIVMPKGNNLSRAAEKSVPASLNDVSKALGQAGLILDDYPQVREVLGVPFIIDWSDLSFLRDSYGKSAGLRSTTSFT
jgi:hypothetical protein